METRTDRIETTDGSFDVHLWIPDAGRGPGIVLPHEIFGVGQYIRDVAADLAGRGYVVAAPDLFWRLHPNWEALPGEEDLRASLDLASRLDFPQAVADCALTAAHLTKLPEVTEGVGTVGFCLGGSIAYALAASVPLRVVLSFYGSAVPDHLGLLDRIACPVFFVFGGSDPYISRDRVAAVEKAAEGRQDVTVYVDESAGHAFHNHQDPAFHHPEAAARVWPGAVDFLARALPVR
ncbi:dienelactone hydrolase family protein [Nonomuraea soli]|uniref:Carboxymethylenebutenolidase n=1 Tax=Nonomuraea soli TaxID=1032476 RepID=A0A7W0CJ93_9ACTN|nr:dienelactone hydrolase family protein [Nonomuraea soli]MBA2892234.1 carboxymethylenebutenolidase [Nonomuraea soli]